MCNYFLTNSYEASAMNTITTHTQLMHAQRSCVYGMILRLYPTVPSAAVLSGTTSPSSTAIAITGSVPSDTVVTGFEVRWQRDTSVGCSDEDEGTISETGVFPNSYQIPGLEPGNRYTITVTVFNAAGGAPASNSVTGTTLETGERDRVCSQSDAGFSGAEHKVQLVSVNGFTQNPKYTYGGFVGR